MQVKKVTDQRTEFTPKNGRSQNINCFDLPCLHGIYGPDDFVPGPGRKRKQLGSGGAGRNSKNPDVSEWLMIRKDSYPSSSGQRLMQELQSLYVELDCKNGDTGCVAIGMGHRGDELAANQVVCKRNDRNALSCFLCSACCVGAGYHENVR